MSLRERLARFVGGGERRHCECRRCGRNLDCTRSACPDCDGSRATYEL